MVCPRRILKGICQDTVGDTAHVAVICPYKAQRMLLQSIVGDMPGFTKVHATAIAAAECSIFIHPWPYTACCTRLAIPHAVHLTIRPLATCFWICTAGYKCSER